MSDQRASYLESSGNGFLIGRLLLIGYTEARDRRAQATNMNPKLSVEWLAGFMALGGLMGAGGGSSSMAADKALAGVPTRVLYRG